MFVNQSKYIIPCVLVSALGLSNQKDKQILHILKRFKFCKCFARKVYRNFKFSCDFHVISTNDVCCLKALMLEMVSSLISFTKSPIEFINLRQVKMQSTCQLFSFVQCSTDSRAKTEVTFLYLVSSPKTNFVEILSI